MRYVHFGMPCTTFSAALRGVARFRSVADPVGPESVLKVAAANTLVRNMLQMIKLLTKTGGFWSIENPRSSLLWCFPGISELGGFTIDLDACAFGAKFPEKGPTKKPTRIFTNLPALRSLGRRCPGTHLHTQLNGRVHYRGKWASCTKLVAEYAWGLTRAWAAVAAPLCVPRRSNALADWIRLALLLAGDVEPNPGPRQRRAIFAVTDVAVGDVAQMTATRYATELRSFEGYLGV